MTRNELGLTFFQWREAAGYSPEEGKHPAVLAAWKRADDPTEHRRKPRAERLRYTRENLNNEALFELRIKARARERRARETVDAVDAWLHDRDEGALARVLAALNREQPPATPLSSARREAPEVGKGPLLLKRNNRRDQRPCPAGLSPATPASRRAWAARLPRGQDLREGLYMLKGEPRRYALSASYCPMPKGRGQGLTHLFGTSPTTVQNKSSASVFGPTNRNQPCCLVDDGNDWAARLRGQAPDVVAEPEAVRRVGPFTCCAARQRTPSSRIAAAEARRLHPAERQSLAA